MTTPGARVRGVLPAFSGGTVGAATLPDGAGGARYLEARAALRVAAYRGEKNDSYAKGTQKA